ncbi:hypothetical protein [Aminirod propionatiphilus]|uniref:hypothetical protein n=1 Tax=Aminirod propionatiphilus TaxID=3415223 RepID=UPI003BFA67D5
MILPAVIAQIYPACPEVLTSLLAPFVEDLKGLPAESERAARAMERWLASVGVPDKLEDQGYGEGDIDRLTDLAMTTPSLDGLLAMAPTPAPKETVAAIYRRSLRPCSR